MIKKGKDEKTFFCISTLYVLQGKNKDIWHQIVMDHYKKARRVLETEPIHRIVSANNKTDLYRVITEKLILGMSDEELDSFEHYVEKKCRDKKVQMKKRNPDEPIIIPSIKKQLQILDERQIEDSIKDPYQIKGRVVDDPRVRKIIEKVESRIKTGLFENPEWTKGKSVPECVIHAMSIMEDIVFNEQDEDQEEPEKLFKPVIDRFAYPVTRYGDLFLRETGDQNKLHDTCNEAYSYYIRDIIVEYLASKLDEEYQYTTEDTNVDGFPFSVNSFLNNEDWESEPVNIYGVNRMIREENAELLGFQVVSCMLNAWAWEQKRKIFIGWLDNEYKIFKGNVRLHSPNEERYKKQIQDLEEEVRKLKEQKDNLISFHETNRKAQEGKLNKAGYELQKLKEENDRLKKKLKEKAVPAAPEESELTETIEALKEENKELKNTLILTNQNINRNSSLLERGHETELFPDEQYETLMDVLESVIETIPEKTRRRDVLQSIIDKNPYQKVLKRNGEILKSTLKGYTRMTSSVKKGLNSIGIKVEAGAEHYKMTYYGDPRYMSVLAKTPSDKNVGINNAFDVKKIML